MHNKTKVIIKYLLFVVLTNVQLFYKIISLCKLSALRNSSMIVS